MVRALNLLFAAEEMIGLLLRSVGKQFVALAVAICFTFLFAVPPVMAREPAALEISLNEAIAMALERSESVKKAEKEIERTEALREEAADQLEYTPVMPAGNPAVEAAWANLLAADLTWRSSKKSLTAEQDAVALDTCKKYWDVLNAQKKVEAAEDALKSAEAELQKVRAYYRVGMVPFSALARAEAQYSAALAGLESARNELNSAYVAFNKLVGLWPEDRPVLTTPVEFVPLEVADLDHEVARVLENCPQVWLEEQKVKLKEYSQDIMFYTGIMTGTFSYKPYEARKIEVEQAELDAASTKKLFEEITRKLYYRVKSLEEAYESALEEVRYAEENLRVQQKKFEVGMATRADIAAAEKQLSEAEKKAFEIACQHAYMKLAFEKPWAHLSLLMSSGAGSAESSE